MTRFVIPTLRRLVQVLSLCLLVLLPLFALYTHYHEARAIKDLPEEGWRNSAIRTIEKGVSDNARSEEWVTRTQGTFWSMRLFGYTLSDPLAGAEAVLGSRSFYKPMMWSLLVPVVVTLLLGRVFCGWICPMNTLLEAVDKLRGGLRFLEFRERNVQFSLRNKYVMLVAGLGLVALTSVPYLAMVYPPAVLSREIHLWIFGTGVGIGMYLMLAICVFELFVSKRWWCRYVCPGGALYSLLGRFRLIRIQRIQNNCVDCGDCVRVCQFGLKPMLVDLTGMECTNCGTCINSCDSDALRFQFVLPVISTKKDNTTPMVELTTDLPQPDSESREGKSTAGKITATVLLLTLLLCNSAEAHHILGLPHYSYKENYPQAPTLEYPATTGPFDVLMTSYPGSPVPTEAALIAFYIKDRDTESPYEETVTMRVLQTATFGSNKVIRPLEQRRPFDNQHKYKVEFPEDGEYIIELTMEVEGQTEVIPFLMIVGEPTATKSIVITIGLSLVLFLVIVRAIKIKRDRRLQVKSTNRNSQTVPAAM